MADYKAFCFDGKGKVWVHDRLVADSDGEAIEAALAIKDAIRLEVRDNHRLVTVVDRQFPTN